MSIVISVKNLVKRYNKAKINAVDDISFNVSEGEFFALLGPNGAGKTTTISILTTILSKTNGTITIGGFDIDRDASSVRASVGIIFQNPSLDANLTAEENVRLHAVLYGIYPFRPAYSLMPEEYKKKIHQLGEVLGIDKDIFKPIKTYSGGMKRKLEIIRSLIHQPKVLFLDEPTSGLDPISRKNLWEYLLSVRKQRRTTIFLTTHYLEEAEGADHICIINSGKIVTLGTPEEIKKSLINDYLIMNSTKRDRLKQELKGLKLKFDENEDIKVYLSGQSPQRVIQSIKTPLSILKTHSPTLEEAYLEIVATKTDNL